MTQPSSPFPLPILTLPSCLIRPYHPSDAPALAQHANGLQIARFMTNMFPSPYTLANAEFWINLATPATAGSPTLNFAICDPLTNTVCGGIGLKPRTDVEARTMEVGYWLGEAYWGRGIMTDAVVGFVKWVFGNWSEEELVRLEAGVFEGNGASAKVLTKAGFVSEGCRRKAGYKAGRAFDISVFGLLREDLK
ncbi:acyl-CoA N-acyltransferase [Lasiosphaeria hispida]|uniref:Acyl-CoA N-acyltransferase n=1 Tax=Lasiosphaeria hispida TaxID=260671 RepID=A0AAJ0M8B7_9PEZI|nr:acyl-CoA N-acyltransferase [Lasiosphaeria hispida]